MVLKTRDLSLFGIGATLYALAAYTESGLEVSLGIPLPLSAVVLGLMLGFMPLWCWGILYAYDFGSTVVAEAVNYSRSLAFFTTAIEAAGNMPENVVATQVLIDPNLVLAIVYMIISSVFIFYLVGWLSVDFFKEVLFNAGIIAFLMYFPAIIFVPQLTKLLDKYGNMDNVMNSGAVEMATITAQASVLAGIWITLVAPFIAHLLFRRTALYRRLRAVNVF